MALEMTQNTFGERLKYWRKKTGLSQLSLALDAEVSQRHISFLESGRAQPTQSMILRLADVLDLDLRMQNTLLTAAGFSSLYTEYDLNSPEMSAVNQAVSFILEKQMPYPALVMDRQWRLLKSNPSADAFLAWFYPQGIPESLADQGRLNLMKLMLAPTGLHEYIKNFQTVAYILLQRLHREALLEGSYSEKEALYNGLKCVLENQTVQVQPTEGHSPVLATQFIKKGVQLNVFSTVTTLGTPVDITLQELRIESFFPADEETKVWMNKNLL